MESRSGIFKGSYSIIERLGLKNVFKNNLNSQTISFVLILIHILNILLCVLFYSILYS